MLSVFVLYLAPADLALVASSLPTIEIVQLQCPLLKECRTERNTVVQYLSLQQYRNGILGGRRHCGQQLFRVGLDGAVPEDACIQESNWYDCVDENIINAFCAQ